MRNCVKQYKLLKRYCKATLDNFSNKKKFDDDKKKST